MSDADVQHYQRLSSFVPSLARESTISILIWQGGKAAQHGCGTLFAIDEAIFLVTAAHVVRIALERESSLWIAPEGGGFVQIHGKWFLSDDTTSADSLDVAALKLDDGLKAVRGHKILRLSDVSFHFDEKFAVCTFFGYPSIWARTSLSASDVYEAKALQYTTYIYEKSTSAFATCDSRFHIALEGSIDEACDENANAATFKYFAGVRAKFPGDLGGIGGCSVWHIGDRKIALDDWPTVEPKVIAIETAVYHDKGAIQATRWNAVATLFYECYPETRPILAFHGITK